MNDFCYNLHYTYFFQSNHSIDKELTLTNLPVCDLNKDSPKQTTENVSHF